MQKLKAIYRSIQLKYINLKYNFINTFSKNKYKHKKNIPLFHEKLNKRGLIITPKEKGKLYFFYAGTNEYQDHSGFLQGLKKMGNVYTLINDKGGYGILSPGTIPNYNHFCPVF
ncbi:hypothetical protein ES708_26487 [subsurface metagenome]